MGEFGGDPLVKLKAREIDLRASKKTQEKSKKDKKD